MAIDDKDGNPGDKLTWSRLKSRVGAFMGRQVAATCGHFVILSVLFAGGMQTAALLAERTARAEMARELMWSAQEQLRLQVSLSNKREELSGLKSRNAADEAKLGGLTQ